MAKSCLLTPLHVFDLKSSKSAAPYGRSVALASEPHLFKALPCLRLAWRLQNVSDIPGRQMSELIPVSWRELYRPPRPGSPHNILTETERSHARPTPVYLQEDDPILALVIWLARSKQTTGTDSRHDPDARRRSSLPYSEILDGWADIGARNLG